jgi:peptidoglycan hydrolase-like protein with peptidoglycan-binding domain
MIAVDLAGSFLQELEMSCVSPIRVWRRAGLCGLLCVAVQVGAVADTTPAKTSSTPTAKAASKKKTTASTHKGKRSKSKGKKRGQQAIESERSRQIQEALIREHYMEGKPSGKWDEGTQAALRRYQADQGWQSKTVPDSRALIKLGLGPSHEHLLNPESAMTTTPIAPTTKTTSKAPPAETPAGASPDPAPKPQHYRKF